MNLTKNKLEIALILTTRRDERIMKEYFQSSKLSSDNCISKLSGVKSFSYYNNILR